MRAWFVASLLLVVIPQLPVRGAVLKQALWTRENLVQGLPNGALETVEGDRFPWWGGYHKGHDIDDRVRHSGRFSARCINTAADDIRGISCNIDVNQTVPTPTIAVGWSKAENVSRPAGGTDGYWLWGGGLYTDGTDMVIHPAPFKYGTHDWQRCTLTLIPRKPLKTASVGGFLIHCTGTVWFDDFELWSLDVPLGTPVFDGYPVVRPAAGPAPQPGPSVRTDDGFTLLFDANTGHVCTQAPGGLFVRDDGGMSHFIQPDGHLTQQGGGSCVFEGEDKALGLSMSATYRSIGQAIRIDGTLRDLRGEDRSITLYFSYPLDAVGWSWQDDARTSRRIEPGGKYLNTDDCQVGANWRASRYPFACVTGPRESIVLGAPVDVPRLWRFAYDADSKELYAAVDLGLSPDTKRFPSEATFGLVLYQCDPTWGFRGALERYYQLFPNCFARRATKEGIWGFSTVLPKIEQPEDFGFQFIQGCQETRVAAEHGCSSFMYCEPMMFWECSLGPDEPRTEEHVLQHLQTSTSERERQTACIPQNENGELMAGPASYMCDGYSLIVNPSPTFPYEPPDQVPRGYELLREIDSAIKVVGSQHDRAWENVERFYGDVRLWQDGYSLAAGEGRNGSAAMKLVRRDYEENALARQSTTLTDTEPRTFTARVWVKTEGVTGAPDRDFGVVVDALYADGSYAPGIELKPEVGTHDWQLLEGTVTPPKALRTLAFHCLLRRPHTGTVWFDDAFLGEAGGPNLLTCGDFEPDPDEVRPALGGVYMDCVPCWSGTRNYRRDHFAYTDTPLVFDSEGRVCQYLSFTQLEFMKAAAERLWPQGMLVMAAGMMESFPWYAPWVDVDAIEAHWDSKAGFAPEPDWAQCVRRALCYQRPIIQYLYTQDAELTPELVELYLKRCTAYAIFPSLADSKLGDRRCNYWETPELYNRDRPLWRKYIPIIRALSAAGWEPITYARSSSPQVHVERFGKPGGPLYLTVYNDSQQPQPAGIQLDAQALGLNAGGPGIVEVLSGASVPVEGAGFLRLTLQPEDVKVLQLGGPR
jgi:hypothetical protein